MGFIGVRKRLIGVYTGVWTYGLFWVLFCRAPVEELSLSYHQGSHIKWDGSLLL